MAEIGTQSVYEGGGHYPVKNEGGWEKLYPFIFGQSSMNLKKSKNQF